MGWAVSFGLAIALCVIIGRAVHGPRRKQKRVLKGYNSRRGSSTSRMRRWATSISGRHKLDVDREVAACDGSRYWSGKL